MHPETASHLVRAFAPQGARILDPFCGSGTVLVEALIHGRIPFGVDLNPLAVRLSQCKLRTRTTSELREMVARARTCAEYANRRRRVRAGATRRFTGEDLELFEMHVLFELDSLRCKIEELTDDPAYPDLSLVLSAILVKLSRKTGDTSRRIGLRRTAAGYASRLFVEKTQEWADRLAAFKKLVPSPLEAFVGQDDATQLNQLPVPSVDAIITSPPYAATYDYLAHHALRLRWLGLDPSPLAQGELGARSTYQKLDARKASEEWSRELRKFFDAAARVLPAGKPMLLLMADSAVASKALYADEIVSETAQRCGFARVACASQVRPHFHKATMAAFRNRPRAEHAILLRRM
jgi:DNA modification methylase